MINVKTYPLINLYLTKEVVSSIISKFWNEVFKLINKNGVEKHLMLLVKVEYSEEGYRTLGHLRRVNFNDKEQFIAYITERLSILNDSYTSISINKVTFTYIVKEGLASGTRTLLLNMEDKVSTTHRFNNYNLPITMNPSEYGTIIVKSIMDRFTRYICSLNTKIFQIDVSLDNLINKVTLLGASELKWSDTFVSEGCFKREIGKSTIYFLDGVEVLRKQQLPSKAFKKSKVDNYLQKYIVTMDIETIKQNNKLIPYLICAYNGLDYITSYADSTLNQKMLFSKFFNELLTFFKKGNVLQVYAHNLSNFDGVFLLSQLLEYGKIEPLYFNGKLMSIKLKIDIKGYEDKTIVFKDSYLLLPVTLRKLCEVFKINLAKGYFPYLLYDIFYTGVFPKFTYWTDINYKEWSVLKSIFGKKMWNFQQEAIKYCKLDCASLHEVLTLFNQEFFSKYQINIYSCLTAPSLAMRLYKTHFMPDNTIYQLNGKVEQAIRESYSGGAITPEPADDVEEALDGIEVHENIFS